MLSQRLVLASIFALLSVGSLFAQPLDVTFRYIPGDQTIFRAYLPGEFNGWGPNSNGAIQINAASRMTFVDSLEQYVYTIPLLVGTTYQYKVHVHLNEAGTDWNWLTDPINPRFNPSDNNNSLITIANPMIFQPAGETGDNELIEAFSAGLFGTQDLTEIQFWVNGVEQDGLPFYNADNGIFRYELDNPVRDGSQFKIKITDAMGRTDSLEVGDVLLPLTWAYPDFETVQESYVLEANVTRQDGTVDSTLTTANLHLGEGIVEPVEVIGGKVETEVNLELGENSYSLSAMIDGMSVESDTLRVNRVVHPLDAFLINPSVGGSGFAFSVNANPVDDAPQGMTINWTLDEVNSTVSLSSYSTQDMNVTGTAAGPGEIYFDVVVETEDGMQDKQRVAVIAQEDGIVRQMRYEETPSWVNQLVVYEIFPLSFGPQASGTESSPGNRLNEITANLDYIAEMGYNGIWFMPIMKNQIMDPISGGYNIVDFYNVDPTLGTNEDFKALVARAHELGIKIIMDITPNHSSPIHPWVEALKEFGNEVPPGSFIQTTPSAHDRGLDNRGPNLEEIWQQGENGNLYRKYNGFGDLANLDWDNDDLQAEYLNILAHWIHEFNIDGWRFDVYWGPWRRYGPDRFGRPIRELMKRIKPDSWLLGENAGTGTSTEVYYADDDNGSRIVGGIDAGYDWQLYFQGLVGSYGDIGRYNSSILNGNFWPGPNARYFRFLENHDEQRVARIFGATNSSLNPSGILSLTGMIMTSTGIPMIYQGQEVNFGDVPGDNRRVSVNWNTERNGEFARVHQLLAHARAQFNAFGTQRIEVINTTNNVYGYVRPYLDENAVVLINFNDADRTVQVDPTDFIENTTDGPIMYTDIFSDSSFVDEGLDGFEVTVPPFSTVIYIANGGETVEFNVPDLPQLPFSAVYTSIENEELANPYEVALRQNYPNPFTSETTIQYSTAKAGVVRIDIYDLLGRKVKQVVDEYKPAGPSEARVNLEQLPSGIYFYRMQTGDEVIVKQLTKVR